MNLDYSMEHSPLTQVNPDQYKKVLTTYGMYCLWDTSGQICKEWYQTPEELADHISNVHIPRGEEEFVCYWNKCGREGDPLKARYKLVNHLRVHTRETPFKCDICQLQFSRAENLKNHKRTHAGEKPFLCPVEGCQRWFSSSSVRRHHARTHSEEKPYDCKKCDKKYTHPCSLKNHIKAKHRKEPSGNTGPVRENPAPEHQDSSGTPGSGTSSPRTDPSDFYQSPAPEQHNLTNTPSYSQVAYSGLDDHNYQIDYYPYDNYDSSVYPGSLLDYQSSIIQ
ncbi:hypothetical protein CAEBREN_08758 [Caenorhabditis brenneri]|uniref:C2H2-type domain-containing protein n=1 Tax=Caenorhabditis brenneri TaxID=135651 RepID=G0N2A5_CAEBE|nr:hypothetical protein CAEBREN_08758 [Caenorhabditis brenneri]